MPYSREILLLFCLFAFLSCQPKETFIATIEFQSNLDPQDYPDRYTIQPGEPVPKIELSFMPYAYRDEDTYWVDADFSNVSIRVEPFERRSVTISSRIPKGYAVGGEFYISDGLLSRFENKIWVANGDDVSILIEKDPNTGLATPFVTGATGQPPGSSTTSGGASSTGIVGTWEARNKCQGPNGEYDTLILRSDGTGLWSRVDCNHVCPMLEFDIRYTVEDDKLVVCQDLIVG